MYIRKLVAELANLKNEGGSRAKTRQAVIRETDELRWMAAEGNVLLRCAKTSD
jgi:hypothetical protein